MRASPVWAGVLMILIGALGGCIESGWGTGEEPWGVVAWSCGDTPYSMTSLIVVYDDGRLVHLTIWQGGHEANEREETPELSDDEALAVAEDVHRTGLIDLDAYRPRDDPRGDPFFEHAESEQLTEPSFRGLERSAERVGFDGLEDRYRGTEEETDHGHACSYRVGVRDGGAWPSTALSPSTVLVPRRFATTRSRSSRSTWTSRGHESALLHGLRQALGQGHGSGSVGCAVTARPSSSARPRRL